MSGYFMFITQVGMYSLVQMTKTVCTMLSGYRVQHGAGLSQKGSMGPPSIVGILCKHMLTIMKSKLKLFYRLTLTIYHVRTVITNINKNCFSASAFALNS